MKHHKYRLQQRKTHSAGTGFWYYRKRIPADVIEVWGAGKKEYVVSLRTRDEREAKRRAALEHDKFLSILEHKRQEKRVVKSKNQKRIDAFMRYEAYLRRMGAHPEQAPRAWDLDAIAKYRAAVEAVKYGITVEHEEIIAPDPTFDENGNLVQPDVVKFETYRYQTQDGTGLVDLLHELEPDSEARKELQQDIEFLEGKRSRQYAYRPDVPTLEDARQAYLKAVGKKSKSESKMDHERRRINRLVDDFATLIGAGSKQDGLRRSLETIRVEDGDWFVEFLRRSKTYASVEREVSVMAAIWNTAVKAHKDSWPVAQRNDNPFAARGKELLDLHEQERLQGIVRDKRRRPFTKYELEDFMHNRLTRMRDDLQLITRLAFHVGCRLEDVTGMVLDDCRLKLSNGRPIPYLLVRHNRLRKVTKDSIERHIPLFGEVYDRLVAFTAGRTGPQQPLFPNYGLEKGNGAGNASTAINKHIKDFRDGDVRLTFHSFRHTVQAMAMAADVDNKWAAYMGGWRNSDSLGLQREYQKGGVPLELLLKNMEKIHTVSNWGAEVEENTSEWDIDKDADEWD